MLLSVHIDSVNLRLTTIYRTLK